MIERALLSLIEAAGWVAFWRVPVHADLGVVSVYDLSPPLHAIGGCLAGPDSDRRARFQRRFHKVRFFGTTFFNESSPTPRTISRRVRPNSAY